MNKRGFELAINTLIILILAIFVLIAAVLFFTGSFKGLTETIGNYFSYSNVDRVINSCNFFVDSNSGYKFCCEKLKVKYIEDDKKISNDFTCNQLLNKSFVNDLKILDCSGVGCG